MKSLLCALALLAALTPARAAPSYVATFHSIGLSWAPPGGGPDKTARVEFRAAGASSWRHGLALWFDARNSEYRGSLVELEPGTAYMVRLTLDTGFTETIKATTWSEKLRVKRARGGPVYATSGTSYPAATRQGDFSLAPGSPGYQGAERIPNFNDAYARPDVGAHQSGTAAMKFGLDALLQIAALGARACRSGAGASPDSRNPKPA